MPPLTRRRFTTLTAALLTTRALKPQSALTSVAAIERDRILAQAKSTSIPTTLIDLSATIANLTAAFLLTKETTYANRVETHLTTWLAQPSAPQPVVDLVPIAEIAVALRFFTDALGADTLSSMNARFSGLQSFLNSDHAALLSRDTKDHRASAWLLLSSAIARFQRDDRILEANRHRFRAPTLRNQITADGKFPQELASPNPFRNTLFNFDLLTGACQLLASPFDDLWNYELQDGPGLRSVAAFLVPFIEAPATWISVADAQHFRDVPLRRPALLFAGRAYNRPEYVNLWRSLPLIIPPELAASFPIREPLLWTTRAPHGF